MESQKIDYAIIGGGIGGVYSAWRLKQAYPDKNVVVFEFSDRIGGRLLSVEFDKVPNMKAELGGMRYLPDQHKIVDHLVQVLNLPARPFPMGSNGDPDGLNNYAYFRGIHLLVKELSDSKKLPFNLQWQEQGLTPDGIQAKIMRLLVPNWQGLSFDDWFDVTVFGEELYKYGFWNLFYRVLSPDAYEFLRYGSGYDTNVSNGNAVVLLPTGGDYSSSNQYMTLVNGMESLPQALADQFVNKYRGELRLNQRLVAMEREGDDYRLTFHPTVTDNGKTREIEPVQPQQVLAEHVILAMPRQPLENIAWDGWERKNETAGLTARKMLRSVLKQSALKIFLAYDYAWWKELGMTAGRSISDLPIRQTFYFTAPDETENSKRPSLLMASYNDIDTIPFWKGLEAHEHDALYPGPSGFQASYKMVEEVHRQVLELHGLKEIPRPIAAAYMDWSHAPFGAGWHCWKSGIKFNEVMGEIRQPLPDENVFICGEAYSADQGWAEGALETAEEMLTKNLGVPAQGAPAHWSPDYMKRLSY